MLSCNLQSEDTIDPVVLYNLITYGVIFFGLIFTACEIGQRITNIFNGIIHDIEKLDWYLLPIEIQRILLTIIINAQVPIVIECYGIVAASRDRFKKVPPKSN